MSKFTFYLIILSILYSCSPVNKQHGYLIDDMLISSEKISKFKVNNTTTDEVYLAMGSPSIEINDVDNVWIYLLSLKEKKIFEEDTLLYQNIYRFVFNDKEILTDMSVLSEENFNKIAFSPDKTSIGREAYGITDQLYDAFTRGQ